MPQKLVKYTIIVLIGLGVLNALSKVSFVGFELLFAVLLLNAVAYYYHLVDSEKEKERWWVKFGITFLIVSIVSMFVINLIGRFLSPGFFKKFEYVCLFFIATAFPAKILYKYYQDYWKEDTGKIGRNSKKMSFKDFKNHYYDEAETDNKEQREKTNNSNDEGEKKEGLTKDARQLSFYFETNQGELIIERATEGVLWTGSAGAGKTSSGIEPSIYQAVRQGAAGLIYDRKAELAAHVNSAHQLFEPDTDFKYINFADLNRSHRCNPLRYMRNSTDAQAFALVIMKNLNRFNKNSDPFWEGTAFAVVSASLWYLKKHLPQFCTIPHLIAFLVSTEIDKIVEMLKSDPETQIMFAGVEKASGSEKTTASIWAGVLIALGKIATRENFYILSGDEVNLSVNHTDDRRFITVSSFSEISQHASVAPLIALIINASYSTMYARKSEERVPTLLQLDEFPTIYLHRFNEVPATIRSSGVCTMLGIQTLPQMVDMFGREETDAILDNLSYQFYGKINNQETAKRVSDLVGEFDKKMKVKSSGQGRSRGDFELLGSSNKTSSESEQIQRRRIIEPQEVRALQVGEFVSLISGREDAPKVRFDLHNFEPKEIDRFREVTEQDIKENFELIMSEARAIC